MKVPFQLDEFYLDLQEDGSKVRILSPEEITKGPFPGLRPFKTSEFQLFFGRMGQGEELTRRLKKNHFLAVIGSSGTGKSSLVRAGLIPQLLGGYLHGAGSKWDIAICRPGKDPVENLAVALAATKAASKVSEKIIASFNEVEPLLNNSLYGLLDVKQLFDENNNKESEKDNTSNLLVIIDQFEELFRFNRKDLGKDNIENQFVNLLLKASADPSRSVYVIITMRSEFLGDCVKYRGLPEAINEGQYLVPQLTRNEIKEVIESPVKLAGKTISSNLVELLINEIEQSKLKENLDQLPILQHALMRTYNNAMEEGPNTVIDMRHYEAIGEMNKALANHAEDKFRLLGDNNNPEKKLSKKQEIAKIIFQSLTELSSDKKSGRRPTELTMIHAVAKAAGAAANEVDEVVDHFRDKDTSFIMPPINTVLNPDIILDISHESLMRNWNRLHDWLVEESKYKSLYRQLNERRELHDKDPEEWLRGTLLKELVDWRETYANNATWAERYQQLPGNTTDKQWHHALYKSNINFLNESENVFEKIRLEEARELKANIAREQKSQAAKNRIKVLTGALIISGLFATWAFTEKSKSKSEEIRANENEKNAKAQFKRADSIAKIAIASRNEAQAERIIAEKQTVIAENRRIEADEQRRRAEILRIEAQGKNKKIESQRLALLAFTKQLKKKEEYATKEKENFEKQLVVNALKDQDFYFSNYISQATKEEIIDSLYTAPSFNARKINLADNGVDTALLRHLNDMVLTKEIMEENPGHGLQLIKQVWSENKHPLVKKLLLETLNENVFPSQTEELITKHNESKVHMPLELNTVNFSVSRHNSFVIAADSQVVTGNIDKDKLIINETSFDNSFSYFFCERQSNAAKKKIDATGFVNGQAVVLAGAAQVKLKSNGAIESITDLPYDIDQKLLKSLQGKQKIFQNTASNITQQFNTGANEFSLLSPDGRLLLMADRDGNLTSRNLTNRETIKDGESKNDTNDNSPVLNIGNYRGLFSDNNNIFFSPAGEHIFINVKDNPRIISVNKKDDNSTAIKDKTFSTLTFSPDSRLVIVAADAKLSVRDSSLGRKVEGYTEINLLPFEFQNEGFKTGSINAISISPNWKRLIISLNNNKQFLLENSNGDSLFIHDDWVNLRLKKIGKYEDRLKTNFINDSTLVSVSSKGEISIWPLYGNFDDADTALMKITPGESIAEKLDDYKISVDQLIKRQNPAELNYAADYYFDYSNTEYLDTAKQLYKFLLNRAPVELKRYYLSRLTDIVSELNLLGRINSAYEYGEKDDKAARIRNYRMARALRLKEIIDNIEQQMAVCAADTNRTNKQLSDTYGSLSFNLLFIKDNHGAIEAAKKSLRIYPANTWVNTNLALAYLLSGNFREADKIYRQYKYEIFPDKSRTFTDAFLQDFKDIEEAGLVAGRSDLIASISIIKNLLRY